MSITFETAFPLETRVTTHARRTMMLLDLTRLLQFIAADQPLESYYHAVIEENILQKPTAATRADSFRYLHQLYILERKNVVFSALRMLWDQDLEAQPVLALLMAVFRDSLFRVTADFVSVTGVGTPIEASVFSDLVDQAFPNRFNSTTLRSVGQNIASSWAQSGHLEALSNRSKARQRVRATPASVAFALFLGYLTGARGQGLFQTIWIRLLDSAPSELDSMAFAAGRRGWLEYRRIGDIAELGFAGLMFVETQLDLFGSDAPVNSARGVHVKT